MSDTDRLAAMIATPAPLDDPVRGVLARAWKRRAKMYKSLYLRHLNEMGQWRSALRLAGIGQMGDLNPDAIRLTITVPSEKRINEMVEERIAAIRDATPAPLDERSYAGEGWGEERAATPVPLPGHQTPGEYHDYRVTCTKCGEPGFLHVSWRPEKAEEPT